MTASTSSPVFAPEDVHPLVGIHQPNFFPWLGFFHKIRWSDTYVMLDDAQVQKTGGSVTNRTTVPGANGKELMFTAPIDRTQSGRLKINEVPFAAREDFRERFVSLLKQTYAKAPFKKEIEEEIFALVRTPATTLGEYNEKVIRAIAGSVLGIETPIVLASTLGITTTSTQRLVDIVEKLGGKTYFEGAGAKDYQDDALFFDRGLNLWGQLYSAKYMRGGEEVPAGMSILDALFHVGPKGTRALLEQPLDPARLRLAKDSKK